MSSFSILQTFSKRIRHISAVSCYFCEKNNGFHFQIKIRVNLVVKNDQMEPLFGPSKFNLDGDRLHYNNVSINSVVESSEDTHTLKKDKYKKSWPF